MLYILLIFIRDQSLIPSPTPMGRLIPFLICLFHFQVVFSASLAAAAATARHLCSRDSSLLLLQFKQSINIDDAASLGCESNGNPSYPKTKSWDGSRDCCYWDGVECDELTGEVIGLDLSCSQLQGVINSNSSLFRFFRLQTLNLAYNDFSSSLISANFSQFQGLTHLNLSSSGFSGSLPSEFLRLFNLVSLDLSLLDEMVIQPHIFRFLLQNSTRLREVSLTAVNIASVLPHNLSDSLTILNLGGTSLYGDAPVEIFLLPNLQMLQLYDSLDLTGQLSKVRWNASFSLPLRYLDMSGTGFSAEVPESIGLLGSLNHLDLSYCKFSGSIPESLGNFTQLAFLDLSSNNFGGQVPTSLANLHHLIHLDLSSNSLQGHLPNFFGNFKNLTDLMLSDNHFTGDFPSSIINATELVGLDLSNNSLSGPLASNISGFPKLVLLFLRDNSFNGMIPSWLFSLPSLKYLDLQSNELTGQLYEFQYQSLQKLFLNDNKMHGSIPKSISRLVNLTDVDLSFNSFSGLVDVSLFSNLKLLQLLSLSNNSLVLTRARGDLTFPKSLYFLYLSSCGLRDLGYLTEVSNLARLDVSHNMLRGQLLSELIWQMWAESLIYLDLSYNFLTLIKQLPFQNLFFLDLRYNVLQGSMPIPSVTTKLFFASNNNFSGEIPPSICQLSSLMVLDFSENNLSGVIPPCLASMSQDLSVIDMHKNRFSGEIPATFAAGSSLRTLNLRENMLEGTLPQSLSKCRELEVLDVGNNNLNGTFPTWLGSLQKLKVLILRGNNLHGPVSSSRDPLSFSSLRILDLSNNAFTGVLPAETFNRFRGMKRKDETIQQLTYIGDQTYQDSVALIIKGLEMNFVRILSIFTTMDLSINNFEGHIPDEIGDLISLRGLNLSHNNLTGAIPQVLGNLNVLESLDLSSNQLEGQIPQKLTTSPFLSFFNVSHNHLTGRIPRGQQFNTFQNNSYLGNTGLCGFPLSKRCESDELPSTPALVEDDHDEGFFNGFTWKAVLIGYGCGMVIGVFVGFLIFITRKPAWFDKIVRQECSRLFKRRWPKEVKWM